MTAKDKDGMRVEMKKNDAVTPPQEQARSRRYHHGNLHEALIEAGISLLNEVGWNGLSLRKCANRAGVSHAAPAHHFGNLQGLLTALAVVAFERFHRRIADEQAAAERTPDAQLHAAGIGYLGFSKAHPGLFQLMFGPANLDGTNADLRHAREQAFAQLGATISPFLPADATQEEDMKLRLAVWSTIHGYAHLLLSNKLDMMNVSEDGVSHMPDLTQMVRAQKLNTA